MKKILKIIAIVILTVSIYSLIPVMGLYIDKDPAPYTNMQAVEKLKDNKGEYFEFVVFSDCHSGLIFNDSSTLKLVRSINREGRFKKVPIDFAVVSGDVTFRGSEWDHRTYNKIRSLINMPVVSAIGNHDEDKDDGSLFKKYIGQKDFAFSDRNSYFIILDNQTGTITDEQFANLEKELEKSVAYAHRFIIMHKAPISPYFQSWYRPERNPWAYRFMKMCEKYKVDIVFSGHEHMFSDKKLGGVRYITSAGGGMLPNFPDSDGGFLHYTVIKVYGDYVDYEVRKIFPPAWEFFTFYMWRDALFFLKNVLS